MSAPPALAAPQVHDVVAIFRDRNPELPRAIADTAGRAAAALAHAAVHLTGAQQRVLLSHRERLPTMIEALIDTLDPAPPPAEDDAGDGLEAPLPVAGLAAVVHATGAPRTAWLWLVEPHPSLEGDMPLGRLKAGGTAEVADLAARDFGQP